MSAHRVLVLGAGYAGMAAAIQLAARLRRRSDVRVTLVNPQERFTERLRLHMAATGQEVAELSIPSLLAGTGAAFVRGWVTAVDADARTVRIDDERVLHYDTLVYALGSVADTAAVPGAAEHAYTLNGAQDAALLANRLGHIDRGHIDRGHIDRGHIDRGHIDRGHIDRGQMDRGEVGRGTVVVAGSGLTGVESAAEIAARHPSLTVVLAGRDEPGTDLNPRARAHLRAALDRLGVRVRAGVEVVKIRPGAVDLADRENTGRENTGKENAGEENTAGESTAGQSIEAGAVLWTSGTRVSPLAAAAGFAVDERGRIITDAALRSVTHPEVYAVGDAAAIRQPYGVMHGTCQGGMPTGVHAAVSIVRVLRGREPRPFRFGYYHTAVSLGRHDAVVQFTRPDGSPRRICLTGRLAVRYKETVTASPWPTYGRMKKLPGSGAWWPHGGRFTRAAR